PTGAALDGGERGRAAQLERVLGGAAGQVLDGAEIEDAAGPRHLAAVGRAGHPGAGQVLAGQGVRQATADQVADAVEPGNEAGGNRGLEVDGHLRAAAAVVEGVDAARAAVDGRLRRRRGEL